MNEQYEALKEALMKFFSDRSQSAEECKDGLKALKDEIDMLIDAL